MLRVVPSRAFRLLPTALPTNLPFDAVANQNEQLKAVERLGELLSWATSGGSDRAKELHKKRNKLFVWERIKAICDEDSEFFEIGALAGYEMDYGSVPRATAMMGIGRVHGVPCFFAGSDGTVKGGTSYPITVKKNLRGQQISMENLLPSVALVDSGGAFLPLQSEIFPDRDHGGRNFYNIAASSQLGIPQMSVVCGSCTAGGAYTPTMCDEMVFVDKMGTMFLGGPPLVEAATGEIVTAEELGGAALHTSVSGCADYFAADEEESSQYIRDIVETLNIPASPTNKTAPVEPMAEFDLLEIAGQKVDARLVLSCLLDASKFHEFKANFGTGLLAGYGRVNGHLVAIVANNGNLNVDAAKKGAHFVHLATERDVPIIFLQNSLYHDDFDAFENNQANIDQSSETLRARAAMMAAVSVSKVPKITFCCAGPSRLSDLCPTQLNPNFIFRWPTSKCLRTGYDEDDAINSSAQMWDDGTTDPRSSRKIITQCLEVFEFTKHHRKLIDSKSGTTDYQPVYRL